MDDGVKIGRAFPLLGKAGHQQDRHLRKVARGRQRQRNPVHDRHLDVGEQEIEAAFLANQNLQCFGAVLRGDRLMPVQRDRARDQLAHGILVVGDQNARHGLGLGFANRGKQGTRPRIIHCRRPHLAC